MSDLTDYPYFFDIEPKVGADWGDDISEERQRELDAILAAWDAETDHGDRKGPFDQTDLDWEASIHRRLTGADVFWLAKRLPSEEGDPNSGMFVLAAANLHLEGADLRLANLGGAALSGVHLERATLSGAQLRRADLRWARLELALAEQAQFAGANLRRAQLSGANLSRTHLERADLREAQLVGVNLSGTDLTGADLRFSKLDRETRLSSATKFTGVSLDQIVFDNVNLTLASWEGVAPLGDEKLAKSAEISVMPVIIRRDKLKSRSERVEDYEAAVRANRLVATALRVQGINDESDIFAYRAALMLRGLRFQRRQFGRWFVSWGLAALSGYGYRLGRIFAAYAIVVLTFAALFLLPTFLNGAIPTIQQAADALQISLNAIHGRVFFAQFHLDTLQSWLATAESVIGIVIEGVFVAMIIQRLFR